MLIVHFKIIIVTFHDNNNNDISKNNENSFLVNICEFKREQEKQNK